MKLESKVIVTLILLSLLGCGKVDAKGDGEYRYVVRIHVDPSTGPYIIRNTIQLNCTVEPLPPAVTYQWNYLTDFYAYAYGRRSYASSNQNISYTPYYWSLRSGWFFCSVFSNNTLIGTVNKTLQYQGYVYTMESLNRRIIPGGNISLRVNISDNYRASRIKSLSWYHNNTIMVNISNRVLIGGSGTELHISNMISSDAGIYQVRTTATDSGSPYCDAIWLPPLVEYHAALAPVTFVISSHAASQDNRDHHPAIFLPRNTVYLTEGTLNSQTAVIYEQFSEVNTIITSTIREYGYTSWYHNGQVTTNGERYNSSIILSNDNESLALNLEIVNATSDDVGLYIGTVVVNLNDSEYQVDNGGTCFSYLYEIDFALFYLRLIRDFVTIIYTIASVEIYKPPTVVFSPVESSLNTLENPVLMCRATGGNPSKYTIILRKTASNVTLLRKQGTVVRYTVPSSSDQFGTYTCVVESLYTTSEHMLLLEETGFITIQVNFKGRKDCMHEDWKGIERMTMMLLEAIKAFLNLHCVTCDLTIEMFQNFTLNCTSSMFSSELIYSDSKGGVTASTLIQHHLSNVSLYMEESVVRIQTPSLCILVANNTAAECHDQGKNGMHSSNGALGGVFFGGLLTGILLCITVICIGLWLLKLWKMSQTAQETNSPKAEPKEVEVNLNEAYQMVDIRSRYQTAQHVNYGEQENEPVYEQPAVI